MSQHYDVIIVGAGVAGLSAAYFLSSRASVLVLERESQPAYHSSGRSAALYIEGYENTAVSDLTSRSGAFVNTPPENFAQSALLHDRGGLTLAGPGDERGLVKYLARWQPLCPHLCAVTPHEARELTPVVKQDWLIGAAYDPAWKSIDVHELLMGYQRGIRHNGGIIETKAEVTQLTQGQNWNVTAADAQYTTPCLVNAAGSWATNIAQLAGLAGVALQPMRRTGVIIAAPPNVQNYPAAHTIQGDVYFKPESPGLMVSPADETHSEPTDAQPEELDIAIALDRFQAMVDHPVERVMHSWAGLRTFAPDRRPVIGFDPRADGFCWVAGQGGFGVQTSPALGAIVADHILDDVVLDPEISVDRLLG